MKSVKLEGIKEDFHRIQRAFPDAELDTYGGWMLLPSFLLPSRYNKNSVPVLFRLFPDSPYTEPHIYVPDDLDLRSTHSGHLDFATEADMKAKSLKRICIKMHWQAGNSLLDAVHLALDFLNNLRD